MFASVLELQPDANKPDNSDDLFEVLTNDKTNIVIESGNSKDEQLITIVDSVPVESFLTTVILINDEDKDCQDKFTESGNQVKFDDQTNHEQLISELNRMNKDQEKILKRQRQPAKDIYAEQDNLKNNLVTSLNLPRPCKLDLENATQPIRSSFRTTMEPQEYCERTPSMFSTHGLPPLPKSLSSFGLPEQAGHSWHYLSPDEQHPQQLLPTPFGSVKKMRQSHSQQQAVCATSHPSEAATTPVVPQLALLRQEMYNLRQLDLSLLGKLWSLNESIQDFRQLLMLRDDHRDAITPPAPSPSSPAPSSADEDDSDFYMSALSLDYRQNPPIAPRSSVSRVPARTSSSDTSSRQDNM